MQPRTGTSTVVASLIVSVAIGLALGLGGFTFIYGRGASYLTNDPAACANCHVMQGWYDGWRKSSHHAVAVCNDCHTPAGFFGKYYVKARNGFHHSWAFTLGFEEPIRITASNREVTEAQCRRCHADIVTAIDAATPRGSHRGDEPMSCIRCHDSVGHMSSD